MPLNKDQKWTVGTGIAVVFAVFIIVALFRPHMPAGQNTSASSTPDINATPSVSPTVAASPAASEPTASLTPVIISIPPPGI